MGGPKVLDNQTGELDCPMHIYRTGNDITPGSWESFLTNLEQLVPFLHHTPVLSKPGCWVRENTSHRQSLRIERDPVGKPRASTVSLHHTAWDPAPHHDDSSQRLITMTRHYDTRMDPAPHQ